MKRRFLFLGPSLVFAFFCLLAHPSIGTAADACSLFTKGDAEGLFSRSLSDGVSRTTMFPAGESCRYSFTEKGGSYGATVRISTTAAIREEGINDSAADVMTRQKKAREAGGHAAATFLSQAGLGEDAFWNGTDLWVLQGDNLLIVTVHSVVDGSFKDMTAARKAREEQDLALSRKAVQSILPRLK